MQGETNAPSGDETDETTAGPTPAAKPEAPAEEPKPFVVDGERSAEPETNEVRSEGGVLYVVNQNGTRKDGPWEDTEAGRTAAEARAAKRNLRQTTPV